MKTQNPILVAVANQVRFETARGPLTLEQLFQIPVDGSDEVTLNKIGRKLSSMKKELAGDDSDFAEVNTGADAEELEKIELCLAVVKQVKEYREEEIKEAVAAKEKASQLEELEAALETAEGKELSKKSPKQIKKMIAKLKGEDVEEEE